MGSLSEILAIILGGGNGSRLFPLTEHRSKLAVSIAGKYRLIDLPISNCINSGINRIAILSQFNSVSLHRHISNAYQSNSFRFNSGWIQIWAAERTVDNSEWYRGTADAVRKQMDEILTTRAENVLILAGDHLYQMDYSAMAQFHSETKADITVAVHPISACDAHRFGILKTDSAHRITDFIEKPKDPEELGNFACLSDTSRPYLGSMGIYLFRTEVLVDLLKHKDFEDFGMHVMPYAISKNKVYGFQFGGFWEDIGTIRSYYEANLMFTYPDPPFTFHDTRHPIYTDPCNLDCSFVERSSLENVIMADGCRIQDAYIRHSIIGPRCQIHSEAEIVDSILLGSGYYDSDSNSGPAPEIPLGIGRNSKIMGAIIDKNTRVGENVIMLPFPPGTNIDENQWMVRDGIIVIPKGSTIQPGSTIGPQNRTIFSINQHAGVMGIAPIQVAVNHQL